MNVLGLGNFVILGELGLALVKSRECKTSRAVVLDIVTQVLESLPYAKWIVRGILAIP
jgi:hypothetical protein